MTEMELRQRVVAKARSWLGKKEADGSHKEILDVYNAIPGVGYKMRDTDPWCAAFVSAVGAACGLTATILPDASCDRMISKYRTAGRWTPLDTRVILQPGDLVFYDWDSNGTSDHVGIIEEVTAGGYRVIEGNMSDAVGRRSISRNYNLIKGFALPDYAAAAGKVETPAEPQPQPETPPVQTVPIGVTLMPKPDFTIGFHTLRQGAGMGAQASLREEVRAVQRQLRALGFDVGRYGLDGEFGPDTRKAVIAYQKSVRLAADGIVGPQTRAALEGVSV